MPVLCQMLFQGLACAITFNPHSIPKKKALYYHPQVINEEIIARLRHVHNQMVDLGFQPTSSGSKFNHFPMVFSQEAGWLEEC